MDLTVLTSLLHAGMLSIAILGCLMFFTTPAYRGICLLLAFAVLRAATINAAKALGKELQLGQIAIGFNADLILSTENPLENLATLKDPVGVIKYGRFFSKAELEQSREKAIEDRSFLQEMETLRKAW